MNGEWSQDREVYLRDPLLREELYALLAVDILDVPLASTAEHSGRDGGVRRMAERLVLLDTKCSANRLAKVGPEDTLIHENGVRLTAAGEDLWLPHDHQTRAHGVPWDCAACAVSARLAEYTGGEPLFRARAAVDVADGRWPGLRRSATRLIEESGLTDRERAGLRRGLVLSAYRPKEWTWWLLARAWVAVSWEAGFRMAGDLASLDRTWCTPLPAGDGFRIELHGTKEDQSGAKNVTRPFRFDPDGGPSAALALAEYLAVRDARLGSAGPLLWWGGDPAKGRAQNAAVRCITTLAEAAELQKKFRSYSPRKGYSAQSAEDGRTPEIRQRGLRQLSVRTTVTHYPDAADSAATGGLMMSRLVEQLGAKA